MNLFNTPIDVFNFLIFVIPGFFFLKVISGKNRTEFENIIYSLVWGICLTALYRAILPKEKYEWLVQNPYTGVIVFSLFSIIIAAFLRLLFDFVRRKANR